MRIRTFTGDTARAAMKAVRAEMGDDAVIIAISDATNGLGVVVRAAVDEAAETSEPTAALNLSIEERLETFLRSCLRQAPHPA